MKIIVIGSSGFIGKHLVRNLASENKNIVYGIDKNYSLEFDGEKMYVGNILEPSFLKKCMQEVKPDLIFYLISFFSFKTSIDFSKSIQKNSDCLNNLFNNLTPGQKVIYVGSSAQYGRVPSTFQPVKENVGFYPVSLYGLFKIFEEYEIKKLANESKVNIVGARLFNITGPGESKHTIGGSIISQLELSNEIQLGNLISKRDFLDVRDVANALVLIAKNGKNNEVYNICSGESISIKDFLKLFINQLKIKPVVNIDKNKFQKNDIQDLVGDNSKIVNELNWKRIYSLNDTIKDVVKGVNNNK